MLRSIDCSKFTPLSVDCDIGDDASALLEGEQLSLEEAMSALRRIWTNLIRINDTIIQCTGDVNYVCALLAMPNIMPPSAVYKPEIIVLRAIMRNDSMGKQLRFGIETYYVLFESVQQLWTDYLKNMSKFSIAHRSVRAMKKHNMPEFTELVFKIRSMSSIHFFITGLAAQLISTRKYIPRHRLLNNG